MIVRVDRRRATSRREKRARGDADNAPHGLAVVFNRPAALALLLIFDLMHAPLARCFQSSTDCASRARCFQSSTDCAPLASCIQSTPCARVALVFNRPLRAPLHSSFYPPNMKTKRDIDAQR
jgi:hypothetical protein